MEIYAVRFWIFFREQISKKGYLLQLMLMAVVIYIAAGIHIPTAQNLSVGYCCADEELQSWLEKELMRQQDGLTACFFSSEEELQQAVQGGAADCGFVLPDLICITSPMTTKAALARQSLSGIFYRQDSIKLLLQADEAIYGQPDTCRQEELLQRNERYLQGDEVFHLQWKEIHTDSEASTTQTRLFPVHGIAGCFIILFAWLSQAVIYDIRSRGYLGAIPVGERLVTRLMIEWSAVLFPVLIAFVMLSMQPQWRGIGTELVHMLLLLLWLVPWSLLLCRSTRREDAYYVRMMIFLLVQLLICPVFAEPAETIPVLRFIRIIFPLGVYIN